MKLKTFVKGAVTSSLALLPSIAFAQGGFQGGAGIVGGVQGVATDASLPAAILRILNILLGLAGLIAVIYLIYGGVVYITSQGEEDEAERGKRIILYAIIGLVVIGLSAVLVSYFVQLAVGHQ